MEVIEVTEREVEVIEVIERGPAGPTGATGPQGPAGAGGVTSVTGTAPIVSSGGTTPAISVTVGTGANTVAAGNDSRIANIAANSITTAQGANSGGSGGTITMRGGITGSEGAGGNAGSINLRGSDDRSEGACNGGSINLSGFSGHGGSITSTGNSEGAGGSLTMSGNGFAGGSINTSGGGSGVGGSIDTSNDGGSINTRGTGSIGFGESGTRTTLTGTATANRAISLPNAGGTLALTTDIPSTFAASAITSGTLDNARINFAAPPSIGNTTPAAGTFTTLAANKGTITASAPVLDLSQTWNNAAVAFTGMRFNATNTASATASLIADWQVNGSSMFYVRRDGRTIGAGGVYGANGLEAGLVSQGVVAGSAAYIGLCSATTATDATCDTRLFRDAADTLAQRRGANGQTYRLYNTFTDASNHERGFMRWSSNVLQIGTEAAGTGTARTVEFPSTTNFTGQFRVGVGAANAVIRRGDGTTVLTANYNTSFSFLAPQFTIGADGTGGPVRFFCAGNGIWEQRNDGNAQAFRIYNTFTSATSFERLNVRWDSNQLIIDAEAGSAGGTLRGIKLGSASTSLLGFFGATPVVQQAAVADATDAASTQARLNDLLARVRTLGLIAT